MLLKEVRTPAIKRINMFKLLESFRKGLIRWNVAPLAVVGVLIYVLLYCLDIYKYSSCVMPEWQVAALFPFMAAIAGLLYKVYDSMQRDRHNIKERSDDESEY
jgi:hypothetical protein